MMPFDEHNQVPLIYKLKEGSSLLLAHPYPCIVDPTRRMGGSHRTTYTYLNMLAQLPDSHASMLLVPLCEDRDATSSAAHAPEIL